MEKTMFEVALPVIGTIAGSALGVVGTLFVNGQRSKIDKEQAELKRIWDLEDADRKIAEEKLEQKYQVYNKILRAAGEVRVTSHLGGSYTDFDIENYEQYIRPEIFEGLHRLDHDVFELTMKLEYEINKAHFLEEAEPEQLDYMATIYQELMNKIKSYYIKN